MEINKPVSTVIIFIITLVLIFLFVWPKYQESIVLQKKLAEKQAEYNNKAMYYVKILDAMNEINSRKEVIGKISSALPSDVAFAPLVYFLQKKSSEAGLIIKSIKFSEVSKKNPNQTLDGSGIKVIKFNMNILGNYQGLKNFLLLLERSARLFEVDSISFNALQAQQGLSQSNNQSQTYNFSLDLQTHTY
ncbi:MAG: hypothetical protein A3A98_00565 [Candidatus Staskawiczbacteria bacterium RIFCSPLOWO2_01_FULL_40_39]|uniref:Type 4a pilus biogenesis protein PilO n=1 Tax=Candidatus Staskawiczbacteria bacterium RIFCSPHIGHO2_01_FULL_39_25 TaxID=1802202 RepID=A0A1G2HNB4_9BACT|nr:MAG: hypothetical protein A2730_00565 [Candidatus Staskawiczbacteria bacterium RIFCSPHIGHO2_01_FULL_39_25]OGZ73227.1 MAG: hypothetical protein A3A98_00565 [Candidatus Staskawiczbacteria bacterium RIFCSPLOWO2_01_FULL_40_39]OGZ76404.1 MAG: hypothetical protein A3I87_01780 [Candidatus Staskawiczbacteria bacterium RIFCSPLOWO2_02_FULL_39_8]